MRNPLGALIDLGRAVRSDVVDPDAHRLIDEREFLVVGRPQRRIAEAGAERRDALLRTRAVRRAERQLVLTGTIAPVRHRLAVWRPARIALGNAGGARHVDDRSKLRRYREDVAARLEHGALPRRRHGRPLDERLGLRRPRTQRRLIGDDVNENLGRLFRGEIQEIEPPAGLKHNRVGTD